MMDVDAVLEEQAHGTLNDVAASLAERDVECIRGGGKECRHAGEVERSGPFGEVFVVEAPVLAAQTYRVRTAHDAERVAEHVRRVIASGRKVWRAAEIETAGDNQLRQADGASHAVPDAELRRIELGGRDHCTRQPVSTEADLVEDRGPEDMRFAHGEKRARQA